MPRTVNGTGQAFDQELNAWNVAKVTAMANMFEDATAFNQKLDGWDVGASSWAASGMDFMFWGASSFNQELGWCVHSTVGSTWGGSLNKVTGGTACEETKCGITQVGCTPPPAAEEEEPPPAEEEEEEEEADPGG